MIKRIFFAISFLSIFILSCALNTGHQKKVKMEMFTEESILNALDSSIKGTYNDFIDLGHGYFELANCRLTVFKDKNEWALVFEKLGYDARAGQPVQMQISFFGNCLKEKSEFNGELSNIDFLDIDNNIYDVLQTQSETISIRGQKVKIPTTLESYQKYGIEWDIDGKNYIGAVLKYLSETNPELTRATEDEVRRCLPKNLIKIMTIDNWYQEEYHQFAPTVPPSKQETFKLIAKVLVTGDSTYYKPTIKPNSHWSFWPDSGGL
jgi:hypothetical protein